MLTSKQRAFLRKLAAVKKPELNIGKTDLSETSFQEIEDLLRTRELVKVQVLKSSELDGKRAAEMMAEASGAEVVQVIGRRFVLYRHSPELAKKDAAILLPR